MNRAPLFVSIALALFLSPMVAYAVTTPPPECVNLPASDWVDVQQNLFTLTGVGTYVSIVYDSAASDLLAAKMPADYTNWAVQYQIPSSLTGLWHCYAAIRCDASPNTGLAFTVGIWNASTSTSVITLPVYLQNGAGNGEYAEYDLGLQDLTTSMYLWVAPPGDATTTPAVYVDRFFFITTVQESALAGVSSQPAYLNVELTSPKVVVTPPGAFADGSVYIEEPNRTSGIRCVFDSGVQPPNLWDNVTFEGTMATDTAGLPYVEVSSLTGDSAGQTLGAFGVSPRAIGYAKPNMSGILARTWGRVNYVDSGGAFFYVDDGSGVMDSSGLGTGIRVIPVTTVPLVGDFVTVTGIASMAEAAGGYIVPDLVVASDLNLYVYMPTVGVNEMYLYGLGTCVSVVDDPLASTGQAAMMPANCAGEPVQYPIPASVANESPVHCYVRVRCDATSQSGNAFNLGIWDNSAGAAVNQESITYQSGAGNGQYQVYDLGVYDLTTTMYVWVGPPGSSQATPAVYVDYISFQRAPVVTNNGRSGYVIVLGNNATVTDSTAAAQLQQNLAGVTGVTLPIYTESQAVANTQKILIGQSNSVQSLLPGFNWSALGTDGIVIDNLGNTLILSGGEPRGVLYAVYDFLENEVGCRWWTSTESYIPSIPKLWISEINETYVPPFTYREPYYLDANANQVFATQLKDDGNFPPITAAYGGHISILGWASDFYTIIPPATYFGTDPTWFSYIGGVWTDSTAQLNLTSPAMVQQAIANVLAWIAANPGTTVVDLSQNDNGNYCECDTCANVATEEGSESGPIIRFVDSVAAAVQAVYPTVKVETLAYNYSVAPPEITKPASNVLIRFSDIEADFAEPLTNSANASMQSYLTGWRAISPNLWVWDYTADFANYIMPQPNLNVFGPNISDFVANNVTGVFEEGDYGSPCGDFCRLKCWVLAHLLWNPSLNETTLISEFCNGYYGAAGSYIMSYLNLIDSAGAAAGYGIGESNSDYSFLTLSVLNQAQLYFNSAAAAVAGNPTLSARVLRDSLPLQQAWVLLYPACQQQMVIEGLPFDGPSNQITAGNNFISTAEEYNATEISEGVSFSSYVPVIQADCRGPATVPSQCVGLTDWIDVPNNMFYLAPDTGTSIVVDSAASTGYAAEIEGNSTDWGVQYLVPPWIANFGKWECYAVVKCASTGTRGNAFTMGIWNSATSTSVYQDTVTLQSGAKNGLYNTYSLGAFTLTTSDYFWFAPVNNPTLVPDIYIDRIFMIEDN